MGNKHSKTSKSKVSGFTTKELKELKSIFKKVDKDKSGELDEQEFREMLKQSGIVKGTSENEYDSLFKAFDADGNGTISFEEVATSLSVLSKGSPEEKLSYLFDVYDADQSNTLEKDELVLIVERMRATAAALGRDVDKSSSFIDGIMTKLDVDKTGHITKKNWIEIGSRTPSLLTLRGLD